MTGSLSAAEGDDYIRLMAIRQADAIADVWRDRYGIAPADVLHFVAAARWLSEHQEQMEATLRWSQEQQARCSRWSWAVALPFAAVIVAGAWAIITAGIKVVLKQ